MITETALPQVENATVYDTAGDKIGKVGEIYFDDDTGQPEWITVNTGLFGTSQSFVPIADATVEGDRLVVPFSKDKVKDAPRVEDDRHLDPDEEAQLYSYYGLDYGGVDSGPTTGVAGGAQDTAVASADDSTVGTNRAGYDASAQGSDNAMTRSEEHLQVGTERRETGRMRLRKYVTTDEETVTVPVQREEVRVEREPITDGNVGDATEGPAISEDEHEVVLSEERPVVSKEAKPVERVRLDTEEVTEEQQVTDEVRKEHIEVDDESRKV